MEQRYSEGNYRGINEYGRQVRSRDLLCAVNPRGGIVTHGPPDPATAPPRDGLPESMRDGP